MTKPYNDNISIERTQDNGGLPPLEQWSYSLQAVISESEAGCHHLKVIAATQDHLLHGVALSTGLQISQRTVLACGGYVHLH